MPDVAQADIIKRSITRGDIDESQGGVLRVMLPYSGNYGLSLMNLPPEPPGYWSPDRDWVLASTLHKESNWAAAISIATTKMTSLAWEVESDIALRAKRGQELFLHANAGKGWVHFLSQHLTSYLTQDNGCFVELVRGTKSFGSRIIGIMHLDPHRCTRTGDPEIPVIYRDRKGRLHELKAHQVIAMADSPDISETWNGIGMCAASRAYHAIFKQYSIEWYLREKVSGLHPLAIYLVNGVLDKQLQGAVEAAKEGVISRGLASFMGAVIVGLPSDNAPGLVTIPLSELPNNFDRKQELDAALLVYSNSIGLDPQDLQPLSGAALGTGAQSQVLDEKGKGRGLTAWRQQWTHNTNEFILPELVSFVFIERDYRDQEKQALVSKLRAEVAKTRIEAGITVAMEEKQMLVDMDEIDKKFLETDMTPGDSLSDTEKPVTDDSGEIPETDTELPPVEDVITKEVDEISQLIEQEKASAIELYEKAIEKV